MPSVTIDKRMTESDDRGVPSVPVARCATTGCAAAVAMSCPSLLEGRRYTPGYSESTDGAQRPSNPRALSRGRGQKHCGRPVTLTREPTRCTDMRPGALVAMRPSSEMGQDTPFGLGAMMASTEHDDLWKHKALVTG